MHFFLKVIAVEFHLFDQIGIPFDNFLDASLIFGNKVGALASFFLQLPFDLVHPGGLDNLHTISHSTSCGKVNLVIRNVLGSEFPFDCTEFMVEIEKFFGFFFNFL